MRYIIIVVLTFCASLSQAQTSKWLVKLESKVSWTKVSPTGALLVGTEQGLLGLSEVQGKVKWSFKDYGLIQEEELAFIPNSWLIRITRKSGKLKDEVIINSETGAVVFDSKARKLTIGRDFTLGQSGYLLLQGLQGLTSTVMLINPATGAEIWQKNDLFGKSIFAEVLDGAPLERDSSTIIVATKGGRSGGGLYCLEVNTGAVIWKSELPQVKGAQTSTVTETRLLRSYTQPTLFYLLKGSVIMGYTLAEGKQAWTQPAKQRGLPSKLIYDPDGLIAASDIDPNNNLFKPTAMKYDYSNGNTLWQEPVKLAGSLSQYQYTHRGLLMGMITNNQNSEINLLDLTSGQYLWADAIQLSGQLEEMEVDDEVLYLRTNLEESTFNLESGKAIGKEQVSGNRDWPLISVSKAGKHFTFSPKNGQLYLTDLKSKQGAVLLQKSIEFEQSERPDRIEWVESGLVLSSAQTVMGIAENGTTIFKTHKPAGGLSGWKKALYATSALLNTFDAMRYKELELKATQASAKMNTPQGRQMADAFAQLGNKGASVRMNQASREFELISKRFKASLGGNTVHFLLTKLPSGQYALVGIDKRNGKQIAEINLGNQQKPLYELDEVSRTVYLLSASQDALESFQY